MRQRSSARDLRSSSAARRLTGRVGRSPVDPADGPAAGGGGRVPGTDTV